MPDIVTLIFLAVAMCFLLYILKKLRQRNIHVFCYEQRESQGIAAFGLCDKPGAEKDEMCLTCPYYINADERSETG